MSDHNCENTIHIGGHCRICGSARQAPSELPPAPGSEAIAKCQRYDKNGWEYYPVKVKVMAVADGYAMVRRPRCSPFVIELKRLKHLNDQAHRSAPEAGSERKAKHE